MAEAQDQGRTGVPVRLAGTAPGLSWWVGGHGDAPSGRM
jgi:hypothetical protein